MLGMRGDFHRAVDQKFCLQVDDGLLYIVEAVGDRAELSDDFRDMFEMFFISNPELKPAEDGEYDITCTVVDSKLWTEDGYEYDTEIEDFVISPRATSS